jgi:hypothetical protein
MGGKERGERGEKTKSTVNFLFSFLFPLSRSFHFKPDQKKILCFFVLVYLHSRSHSRSRLGVRKKRGRSRDEKKAG